MTIYKFFLLLLVDDGALTFNTKWEIILGTYINFNQMKWINSNMQFDCGDKDSKTEAIYSPSRSKVCKWLSNDEDKRTFLFKNYLTVTDPNKREHKLS